MGVRGSHNDGSHRGNVAIAGKENIEDRAIRWVRENQRTASIIGGVILVIAAGAWFWLSARERRETFAERALQGARSSAEAGNLPLAASDLARMVSTYGGTRAAQEGTLLLAQVRLLENQAAIAATDLKQFIASGPREEFRAPANALLGAALEETGQPAEAGRAYEAAAETTSYPTVRSQYLLDAARTFAVAGDTTRAVSLYRRVVADGKEDPAAIEAQVRLAELTKGAPEVPKS